MYYRGRPGAGGAGASTCTSASDNKIVNKDLIPNSGITKVPMHGRRVELEKNGFVIHEFPFQ